jgi:epsilon-lactone hydrolase
VKSTLIQRDKLPHVWPTMLMLPEARRDLKISGEFVTRVARRAVAKAA